MHSFNGWLSENNHQPRSIAELEGLIARFKLKYQEPKFLQVVSDVMVRRQSRQVCRKLKAIMKEDKKRTFEREHEAIINHLQMLSKSGEGVTLVEMVQKSNLHLLRILFSF